MFGKLIFNSAEMLLIGLGFLEVATFMASTVWKGYLTFGLINGACAIVRASRRRYSETVRCLRLR
jgi:hypothetical protein